jgi:hypothetical protein
LATSGPGCGAREAYAYAAYIRSESIAGRLSTQVVVVKRVVEYDLYLRRVKEREKYKRRAHSVRLRPRSSLGRNQREGPPSLGCGWSLCPHQLERREDEAGASGKCGPREDPWTERKEQNTVNRPNFRWQFGGTWPGRGRRRRGRRDARPGRSLARGSSRGGRSPRGTTGRSGDWRGSAGPRR